jgi:hypothetical protein
VSGCSRPVARFGRPDLAAVPFWGRSSEVSPGETWSGRSGDR